MQNTIRDSESAILERELVLLDNVRWALEASPARAWDVVTKMMAKKSIALADLHDSGVR